MARRVFGQDVDILGLLRVLQGDLRLRIGNTGGGDFYGRNVLLGPVSYLSWNDGSGARLFAVGPDTSSNDFLAFFTGPSPAGGGTDPFNIERTTGRVVVAGQLLSTGDALFIGDGTVSVGHRAYATKSVTFYEFYVDGTFAMRIAAATVTLVVDASLGARYSLTQVTSPANLTASQNNWQPAGTSSVPTNIRLTANAGLQLTGMTAGLSGQRVTLWNVGSNSITLVHESGSSTTTNRFRCPGAANFTLRADGAVDAWYDPTSGRWRLAAA